MREEIASNVEFESSPRNDMREEIASLPLAARNDQHIEFVPIKVVELSAGKEIAVPKLGMFMPGVTDNTIMDKHCKYYQTKGANDTQHNNHFYSPLSTLRIKNKIIKDANIAQNTTFCDSNSLEKNSPAKYPATTILEKSPTSFAIDSLDFGLSHFIYMIKHITDFIACQADILERKAYNVTDDRWDVVAYSKGY